MGAWSTDSPLPAPGKRICHRFQDSAIIRIAMSPSPREILSSGISMAALEYYQRFGSLPTGEAGTCVWAGKPAGSTGGGGGGCLSDQGQLAASHKAPGLEKALGRTRDRG